MTAFAPRPTQPAALATVTPAVEAKVHAWRDACRTREAMWQDYLRHSDAHRARQLAAQATGTRIRRNAAFTAAEARFDAAEHRASHAEGDIERELRAANPGADNRTIMATKRELTRSPL